MIFILFEGIRIIDICLHFDKPIIHFHLLVCLLINFFTYCIQYIKISKQPPFSSLQNDKTFDRTKLRAFADDEIDVA